MKTATYMNTRELLSNARRVCENVIELKDPEVSRQAISFMADLMALIDENQLLHCELEELKTRSFL